MLPFNEHDHFLLEEDWTFPLRAGRTPREIWEAFDCDAEPEYAAQFAAAAARELEKDAILARGFDVDEPWVWRVDDHFFNMPTTRKPQPDDEARFKELEAAQAQADIVLQKSRATLPTGTVIGIVRTWVAPLETSIRIEIIETAMPALRLKSESGKLDSRVFNVDGFAFETAKMRPVTGTFSLTRA